MIEVQYWLGPEQSGKEALEIVMKKEPLKDDEINTSWRSLNYPGTDYIISKVLEPITDANGKEAQIVIIEEYSSY